MRKDKSYHLFEVIITARDIDVRLQEMKREYTKEKQISCREGEKELTDYILSDIETLRDMMTELIKDLARSSNPNLKFSDEV